MDFRPMGRRLKEARERKGYTQEQLAEKLDLSVQHISVMERGIKTPRMETFIRIANELDVDANFLLSDMIFISPKFISNDINIKIEDLPEREKRRILAVVKLLVDTAK